jgi:solute carrier family 25 S-adenosylmethionine transporter 26
VDLLFYPIDSIKTRLQSDHGFHKAGGFRGIYNGVGSVIVGSAPGGTFMRPLFLIRPSTFIASALAAVFFCTYDVLKRILPTPPHLAPVSHMLSASIGEVVRDISA